MDAVTNATGTRSPEPGSITICAHCFEPCRFDDQMRMQKIDWDGLSPLFKAQLKKIVLAAKVRLHN